MLLKAFIFVTCKDVIVTDDTLDRNFSFLDKKDEEGNEAISGSIAVVAVGDVVDVNTF